MVNEALQFGTQFPAWLLLAGGAALGWLRNFWQLLYNHKITASDLLNFIDGIIASQGRLLVMTTNHPRRLDPALVRAGRVDKRWAFDYAQRPELEAFYNAAQAQGLACMPMEDFFLMLPVQATIADAQALLLGQRQ